MIDIIGKLREIFSSEESKISDSNNKGVVFISAPEFETKVRFNADEGVVLNVRRVNGQTELRFDKVEELR